MSLLEASRTLESVGLKLKISGGVGVADSQEPKAGTTAHKGDMVKVKFRSP